MTRVKPSLSPVTIRLPVYSGERYLAKSNESLLAQTYCDFKTIMCDNALADSSGAICQTNDSKDPHIVYFRNEANLGAGRKYDLCSYKDEVPRIYENDLPGCLTSQK